MQRLTKKIFPIIFATLLFLVACSAPRSAGDASSGDVSFVKFMKNTRFNKVLAESDKKNKPIFMVVSARWCMPCKLMEEEIFTNNVDFASYFNDKFVNYKVDAEKETGPDLALMYEINAFPTLLYLDRQGNVLWRKSGYTGFSELERMGEYALQNYK